MLKLWKSHRHIRGDPPITVLDVVGRVASVVLSGHMIARVYADSNARCYAPVTDSVVDSSNEPV